MATTQPQAKTVTVTEADLEKMVLERLNNVLPAAVHDAVHACLPIKQASRAAPVVMHQPKAGGKCRAVWDELDQVLTTGSEVSLQLATELAQRNGWNVNNARAEFYRWKAFRSINPIERRTRTKPRKTERRVDAERRAH